MAGANALDDLAKALILQSNMLVALIRSHPNREVLTTNLELARQRFPDSFNAVASQPDALPLSTAILTAFQTALTTPL